MDKVRNYFSLYFVKHHLEKKRDCGLQGYKTMFFCTWLPTSGETCCLHRLPYVRK